MRSAGVDSIIAFLYKTGLALQGMGFAGSAAIGISYLVLGLSLLGELYCENFSAAKTQRCVEVDLTVVSGCSNAVQIARMLNDPDHPVGRGSIISDDRVTNSELEFLRVAMWYRIPRATQARLTCKDFDVKPVSRNSEGGYILVAGACNATFALMLAVYASRISVLKALSHLERVMSPDSLEFQDWLLEAESQTIGSRPDRHRNLALTWLISPLYQILSIFLGMLVMSMCWEGLDFLLLIPRSIHFSGLISGRPLVPLNGWRKQELFYQTGTDKEYGGSVKTDHTISRDSVYVPPTFESGLAGTTSRWEYLLAMWRESNLPTPLNILFPSQLACDAYNIGSSGSYQLRNAICAMRGNAGMRNLLRIHHVVLFIVVLHSTYQFLTRISLLVPCLRRRSLRRALPSNAQLAADRLSIRLSFSSWLVLSFFLG